MSDENDIAVIERSLGVIAGAFFINLTHASETESGTKNRKSVSYTHLTLPTNREV